MRQRELSTEPIFYVYIFFRLNGIPCYVGKGNGGRWVKHVRESHNKRLQRIFAQARQLDIALPVFKVREALIEAEAFRIEADLIKEIGRADLGMGPLVNLTDGGDGISGYRHTKTAKDRIGAAGVGRKASLETRSKMSAWQIGRIMSDGAKAKMSAAAKRRPPMTDEHKAKIGRAASIIHIGRKRSAETIAKISAIKKAEWEAKPEWHATQQLLALARWADPEMRARMLAGNPKGTKQPKELVERRAASNRGKKRTSETRAKMSAWQIGRKMSAEAKAKMSAAGKARAADPSYREMLRERAKNGLIAIRNRKKNKPPF